MFTFANSSTLSKYCHNISFQLVPSEFSSVLSDIKNDSFMVQQL